MLLKQASAIVAVVAIIVVSAAGASATASTATIDTSSRAAVTKAFIDDYLPTTTGAIGWTGSVKGCVVGHIRPNAISETLTSVNFMRSLAGLDAVGFTSTYNLMAQKAALVYRANDDLTHDIPKSWDCYSAAAHTAGASSNIALGVGGAAAVPFYMSEPGSDNALVGHRRWILYPPTKTMGTGATSTTQVLWVFGAQAKSFADPAWVSWPTAGYFPTQLEPDGRWSLSGDSTHSYDFSKAKVTVTSSTGTRLKVSLHGQHASSVYGSDTLVWEVAGVKATGDYTVNVTGIKRNGKTVSHTYTVKLFNPLAP